MNNELFTPMELDALGEIMNIALGSSATVVSNILGHRVAITTPRISVADPLSFELGDFNPAFGVEISYLEGLSGSNILLLKRRDVKMILDILMGEESGDEELELNELTVSAICELMNQMMGAASTALSEMLSCTVNISTPLPFELNDPDTFRLERLPQNEKIVAVRFSLNIEGVLNSEFINIISVSLAKEFLGESFMAGNIGPQEEPVQSSPKKETERPASFPVVEPVPAAP
ncbi:MAG: chemotaxis protein CheC, partial [Firmicutes bacterium]|nr:chemotaxis protein CheC [Bacillota bacterium]